MDKVDSYIQVRHCTICNKEIVGNNYYRPDQNVAICSTECLDEYWENEHDY